MLEIRNHLIKSEIKIKSCDFEILYAIISSVGPLVVEVASKRAINLVLD